MHPKIPPKSKSFKLERNDSKAINNGPYWKLNGYDLDHLDWKYAAACISEVEWKMRAERWDILMKKQNTKVSYAFCNETNEILIEASIRLSNMKFKKEECEEEALKWRAWSQS